MKQFLVTVFIIIFLVSCKKDNSKPSWDIDVELPLLQTTMSIKNIVNDTVLLINSDNSVSLVYTNSFYDFSLDTIFKIPDTTIEYTAKLSNLKINDILVSDGVSLGDIALKDKEENGPSGSIYTAIINGLNSGLPTNIPAIPTQAYNNLTLDATEYFESLTISEGFIDITIENQLPIPITNLEFVIKNAGNLQTIIDDAFPVIYSGETVTSTKVLSNITIEGILNGDITLDSPGGNSIIITDTSKSVTATINIHDIKISAALAKFPNQNIIELNDKLILNVDNTQINELEVRTGNININIFNTLPQPINFEYKMPKVLKNSVPLTFAGVIPAANGGNAGVYTNIINLSDYQINMRGLNNDTVNTLNYTLSASIDSTGQLIALSLNDSIYLKSSFSEVIPNYAQGWFGNENVQQQGETDFAILTELANANINFDEVKLSVSVENQVGVKAGIFFNEIKAKNTNKNLTSILSIPIEYTPFIVEKPINTGSSNVTPTFNVMNLDNSNSNANELINIIPNKFYYDLNFATNYNETPPPVGTGTDFIYYGAKVKANIDVEIPLSLIASNLQLSDTIDMNITENINEIESGSFYLFSYNGFPLEAVVQMYLLDDSLNIADSIFIETNTINAGNIDLLSNKVIDKKITKLNIPLNKTKFLRVLNTKKIVITAKFNTKPDNEHVKIYSNYEIKFKMTGDFTYKIGVE